MVEILKLMINRDSEIEILSTNELGSWNANILCVIEVLKLDLTPETYILKIVSIVRCTMDEGCHF